MKIFDPSQTSFQINGMIPESGDTVTNLWGLKMVENLLNGYGLIGTIRLDTNDIFWLNLNLSKMFTYPPDTYILYKPNDYSGLIHNDSIIGEQILNFKVGYWNRVVVHYSNDLIGFRANLGTSNYVDVYFKIHGV